MGPSGRITHVIGYIGYILHILDCLGQDMQVLYLGRAPRTKETLPDFLKELPVQRTPGFGASHLHRGKRLRRSEQHLHRGEPVNGLSISFLFAATNSSFIMVNVFIEANNIFVVANSRLVFIHLPLRHDETLHRGEPLRRSEPLRRD